jgi:hypothetical protein
MMSSRSTFRLGLALSSCLFSAAALAQEADPAPSSPAPGPGYQPGGLGAAVSPFAGSWSGLVDSNISSARTPEMHDFTAAGLPMVSYLDASWQRRTLALYRVGQQLEYRSFDGSTTTGIVTLLTSTPTRVAYAVRRVTVDASGRVGLVTLIERTFVIGRSGLVTYTSQVSFPGHSGPGSVQIGALTKSSFAGGANVPAQREAPLPLPVLPAPVPRVAAVASFERAGAQAQSGLAGTWRGALQYPDGRSVPMTVTFSDSGAPVYKYSGKYGAKEVALSQAQQRIQYVPNGGGVRTVTVLQLSLEPMRAAYSIREQFEGSSGPFLNQSAYVKHYQFELRGNQLSVAMQESGSSATVAGSYGYGSDLTMSGRGPTATVSARGTLTKL